VDVGETGPVYRRGQFEQDWHFCRNCSQWPIEEYEEQSAEPASAEFCLECRTKRADGICEA
jgi:hypothetical protein